jgi:hypothetical protein
MIPISGIRPPFEQGVQDQPFKIGNCHLNQSVASFRIFAADQWSEVADIFIE